MLCDLKNHANIFGYLLLFRKIDHTGRDGTGGTGQKAVKRGTGRDRSLEMRRDGTGRDSRAAGCGTGRDPSFVVPRSSGSHHAHRLITEIESAVFDENIANQMPNKRKYKLLLGFSA